jgi:tRNA pseudouridine55 synthase
VRRVGHTGTLDPFATGVLPVCVGKATRLARFLTDGEKVYEASVHLGFATTTDDLTGEPLAAPAAVAVSRLEIERACAHFRGRIRQVPPAFSAKRVGGRRLYDLAREGVVPERLAVPVEIHAIDVKSVQGPDVTLVVSCSPGTYIRALARDLGEALGCGAHLSALRRTSSGGFGLEHAVPLSTPEIGPDLRARLVPLRDCLPELPAVSVTLDGREAVRHGRDLSSRLVAAGFPDAGAGPHFRVLGEDGDLLALAVPRAFHPSVPGLAVEPFLHPEVVLVD